MRITGGTAKGRQLLALKDQSIRPTSSKVREAVFNIIGQDTSGKKVLDLFAGTGILGIEALSRGAAWAQFIDHSIKAVRLISKNLQRCGFENLGYIQKREIFKSLNLYQNLVKEPVDLVFIDPPYGKGIIPPILIRLSGAGILTSQSIVVAESFKIDKLPAVIGNLHLSNTRIYGETKIDIYYYEDN